MTAFFKPSISALSMVFVLSACNLAPKYDQPQIALPSSQYRYDMTSPQGIQAASLGWQDYFADPRLHQLIDIALKNNTDLRSANLNVEQVRQQYAIRRAEKMPHLSGDGGASRTYGDGGASRTYGDGGASRTYTHSGSGDSYRVGLGISAFELDLWGRVRNSNQAALQQYFATAAARDGTHLSLISSVAKAHFNEIYANNAIILAQRTLESRQKSHELAQLRHRVGVMSTLHLRQQEALVEQAKANYASAIQAHERARNALELLINQPLPEHLPAPLPLNQQIHTQRLNAGLSSDLLFNRPDIIAAEHQLKADYANIGAARAAFFPRISLTSSLGFGSNQLHNLFKAANHSWSFGGNVVVPIFDWGINQTNLKLAKISQQKNLIAYEAAIKSAFRDVSDALVARAALHSQFEANLAQSKANAEVLRLTHLRYQHGIASSLDLLDAERSSYAADDATLRTELNLAENLADLYKVLGGGLKRFTQDEPVIQQQMLQVNDVDKQFNTVQTVP